MTIQMDVQDVVSGNGGNKYCLHFVSPEQGVAYTASFRKGRTVYFVGIIHGKLLLKMTKTAN